MKVIRVCISECFDDYCGYNIFCDFDVFLRKFGDDYLLFAQNFDLCSHFLYDLIHDRMSYQ